jgi:hypothetical protein
MTSGEAVMTFVDIEIHGMQSGIRLQLSQVITGSPDVPRFFYCFAPVFLM